MPINITGLPRQAKPTLRNSAKPWFSVRNVDGAPSEVEILIYEEIGSWMEGTQAEEFVRRLNGITADVIHLRVNCPGGSVFDGIAIFNALDRHPAKVIAHVDGLAASTASWLIMAADEIRMAKNAYLMIHDPIGLIFGDATELRELADKLDKMQGTIAQMYADRSGGDVDDFKSLMAAETWFTAQEALDKGLCDAIEGEPPADVKNLAFDLSLFNRVPEELRDSARTTKPQPPKTVRELENSLVDLGYSRVAARNIASRGFKVAAADPRDGAAESEPRDEAELRDLLRNHISTSKTLLEVEQP